jgi:hypothetical protein
LKTTDVDGMLLALSGFEFTTNRYSIHSNERCPMKTTKTLTLLLASLMLVMIVGSETSEATPKPAIPNPILYLTGLEHYSASGKNWVRYQYDVFNKADYPAELFAAAPALPPCGANTKASRTWVDFFDQTGKRLYGFCALSKPTDLSKIWFALEEGVLPPSYIYIELNDRQTNTKYKSNLADTTL